jgi:hypothetical protein
MLRSAGGPRLARSTGAMGGLIVIVLGLWGALIPFVGPYFGYGFGPHASWHYSDNRLWLDILPGAVAVLGGAMMLGAVTRRGGLLAGWVGLAAGAWFLIGPSLAITWTHGAVGPIGAPLGGHTRQMLEYVGFFYGVGGLIVTLVAFASGRFFSRPLLAGAAVAVATPPAQREARFDAGTYDGALPTATNEAAYPASTSDSANVPAYGDATAPARPAPSQTTPRGRRGFARRRHRSNIG